LLLSLKRIHHGARVSAQVDRDQCEDQCPDASANRDSGGLDPTLILDVVATTLILPAHSISREESEMINSQ
jgi:hypothetical protein